jgi:hypothetical protein
VKSFVDSLPGTPRTRQNVKTKLGQFLNFCRLKKWITQNPVSAIKVKVPSSEVSILGPEEAKALLMSVRRLIFPIASRLSILVRMNGQSNSDFGAIWT